MVLIFIAVRNGYLNLLALLKFATTQNELKRAERKPQPATTIHNNFPYYVHNQTCFDNPFINGRGLIYLGISKMSFMLSLFTRFQGNVPIEAARNANIWLHAIVGSWKSRFKIFEFKCLWNQGGCSP